MALHAEHGILGTSWEDIAHRADVSPATVYRYFPSLDELVPACSALTQARIRPPRAADAVTLFADAADLDERIARLVGEWSDFYARGADILASLARERHLLPRIAESLDGFAATHRTFVREALMPVSADERTSAVVAALTGFPMWQSLAEQGIGKEEIPAVMRVLVARWLASVRRGK